MKRKIIAIVLLFILSNTTFSQVGIGTTSPNANAILELDATNKALLLPRVANTTAIATPVNGMVIYAENPKCFKGYANNTWVDLTPCSPVISAITVASPTYQGTSAVNNASSKFGIGYNGETVPSASTITLNVTVSEPTSYALSAVHSATDLTYSASGSFSTAGTFTVILSNNNAFIPATTFGTLTLPLTGASNSINLSPRIDIKSISANGWVAGTHFNDVVYGGQTWMDRNLGARRVATSETDGLSFGNYYQWGRPTDGHEIFVVNGDNPAEVASPFPVSRTFNTTITTLAGTDTPNHINFITTSAAPNDWRSDNNNNRWATASQGPCPTGYRVPTQAEWQTALAHNPGSGSITSRTSGFDSALKFPANGGAKQGDGSIFSSVSSSRFWTRTTAGTSSIFIELSSGGAYSTFSTNRAQGFPIRCIKN